MSALETDAQVADRLWADYSRRHDPRTRASIIGRFAPLAKALAHRYTRSGGRHEDLGQVALLGLVRAVDRFDPTANVRFVTFATPTILGELRHHLRDHGWQMRVPRALQELAQQVSQAETELAGRLGRRPTPGELAERLEVSEETVVQGQAVREVNRPLSLDGARQSAEGKGAKVLEESLGCEDPALQRAEDRVGLRQALRRLRPLLRQVVQLRYFDQLSQRAVARRLGLSAMQICRLERQAIQQIRQQFTAA